MIFKEREEMVRRWTRDNNLSLINEDCPRGAWNDHGWPVKVGSATCIKDCCYCGGEIGICGQLSGAIECNFKESLNA